MAAPVYLVDAYNLIHAVDRLLDLLATRGQAAATEALVDLVSQWLLLQPAPPEVTLVFDGARPSSVPVVPGAPTLRLRFMDHRADEDLTELIAKPGPRVLVSDDGEVVAAARRAAQDVVSPRAFMSDLLADLEHLGEVAERERPLRPDEVDAWLEHFGQPRPKAPPAPPPGTPNKLSADEVRYWLRYFGEA